MTRKKKIITVAAVSAAVLLVLAGYFFWLRPYLKANEVHITEKIHLLKETAVPLRFKILPRNGAATVIAVKLFDLDNNIIERFEADIADGSDIGFAFSDIEIDQKHIIFPVEMRFSSPKDSLCEIDLKQYYFKDGYPKIYASSLIDTVLCEEIGKLSSLYISGENEKMIQKRYHGVFKTIKQTLKQPTERTPYEMVIKRDGSIYFNRMTFAK